LDGTLDLPLSIIDAGSATSKTPKQMAEDMLHLLRGSNNSSSLNPLAFGSAILNAYAEVADILRCAIKPTPQPFTATTAAIPLPRILTSTPIKPIPAFVPLLPPPVPLPRVPILLSKPFPLPAILRRSPPLLPVPFLLVLPCIPILPSLFAMTLPLLA
jgi:hypothetical protein